MKTSSVSKLVLAIFSLILYLCPQCIYSAAVTYDGKNIIINGQRRILISGSIHYPRSTPDMWEDLIQKAKDGGLDVIDTYVFWDIHEPSPGNYNFQGRYNLVRFIKTVQRVGLYVTLRIGPYVCAEWNFGGFPVWLKYVPGISFRTDNEPFKRAMQGFTQKIVGMMKAERLFASQGGPIILSQIENEYGVESRAYGAAAAPYIKWAAEMAVGLNTGVPWLMCKEDDAPDPVINTCNGFYCDYFKPNKPYKPMMWTEAWSGWFSEFGGTIDRRPVEDLAFAVTRFVGRGGSYFNYYMYHGGTNFGRTSGGPFVTTSYDYDAPIDEYGLLRQPKYGHLKELNHAIKLCERALTSSNPVITSLGAYKEAVVFSSGHGECAAFLNNFNPNSASRVLFNNVHYDLPAWSTSILPDCRNAVFNTARVGAQTSLYQMFPSASQLLLWETYDEDVFSFEDRATITAVGLLEQTNVTRDSSDYLWYTTSVQISSSESFLRGGPAPSLTVHSAGDALHVFINGQLSGSAYGTRRNRMFTFTGPISLHAGMNRITLLSMTVGLPNDGVHFETWSTGILGPVVLQGLSEGKKDLSWQKWSYQVGLKGETMNLYSPNGASSVEWMQSSAVSQNNKPLTWYKAYFDAPSGNEPLAFDMQGMGKGQIWINGHSIGRYWLLYANGNCNSCSYEGTYRSPKCQSGCGLPTQRWYHVPRSWIKPRGNLLVVFEELGGDASKISLVKRATASVCGSVNEQHLTVETEDLKSSGNPKPARQSSIHLKCAQAQTISSIKFASLGTPTGTCGSFIKGSCHAANSQAVLEKICVGNQTCTMAVSNTEFGADPCPNVLKRLSVEAACS